jgi:hypothetical protein
LNIDEATNHAIQYYKELLAGMGVSPMEFSNVATAELSKYEQLCHVRWMCDMLLHETTQHYSLDKKSRWLGFIQAVLILNGITTIEAERNRTRPWFKTKESI